ncbi:MAG: DUF1292 domain-containing protein [Clostridia bacterium]|nr:DUF1292 domain-containing protein [Clostridia bacterium]
MLLEDFTLSVVDIGEEYECTGLFSHRDEKTGKEYVVYTRDDESDDEMCIYSAERKIDENGDCVLEAIETEEEQAMVDALIDQFLESLEDSDE